MFEREGGREGGGWREGEGGERGGREGERGEGGRGTEKREGGRERGQEGRGGGMEGEKERESNQSFVSRLWPVQMEACGKKVMWGEDVGGGVDEEKEARQQRLTLAS